MISKIHYTSPVGALLVAADENAILALVFEGQKYHEQHLPENAREGSTPLLDLTRLWLDDYFAAHNPPLSLPLNPRGTAYQKRVWTALQQIPYGKTLSYGQLAKALNSSPRAVGAAVGKNPISILIPCHRVIGADGSLIGYAGGLEKKEALLSLEQG